VNYTKTNQVKEEFALSPEKQMDNMDTEYYMHEGQETRKE
jgi:hypothetical protein